MTKWDFLTALRDALRGLPPSVIDEQLAFYSEMIDDRMDEGVSEADAVAALGDAATLAGRVVAELPLTTLVRETVKPGRRMRAWEIVLLILGSPVWLSLLIALVAVALSLYVSLWAIIIALWAVFASCVGCAVGGAVAGVVFSCLHNPLTGIAVLGAALALAGLSIFVFFGCKAATIGAVRLSAALVRGIKRACIKKEATR